MNLVITPPEQNSRGLVAFRHNMSLIEHKIFLYLLRLACETNLGINNNTSSSGLLTVNLIKDLAKKINKTPKNIANACRKIRKRKNEIYIYWNDNLDSLAQGKIGRVIPLFTVFNYDKGMIEMQFNPSLTNLLKAVNNKFTHYHYGLATLAQCQSKYALRLQEMLVLGRAVGTDNTYDLITIKTVLLGASDKSYNYDKDFITYCLIPAVNQIKNHATPDFSINIRAVRKPYRKPYNLESRTQVTKIKFSPQKFKASFGVGTNS